MNLLKTKKIHPQDLENLVSGLEAQGFTTKTINAKLSELNSSEFDEHFEFEAYKDGTKVLRIKNQVGFIKLHKLSNSDANALVSLLSEYNIADTSSMGLAAFLFIVFIVAFLGYLLPIAYEVSDELAAVFLWAFGVLVVSFASIELGKAGIGKIGFWLKLSGFGLGAVVLAPASLLLMPAMITSLRNKTAQIVQNGVL